MKTNFDYDILYKGSLSFSGDMKLSITISDHSNKLNIFFIWMLNF